MTLSHLTTPRLVLRPFEESDAWWIKECLSDYGVTSMLSDVPFPYGDAEAARFIATAGTQADAGTGYHFAIVASRPLGCIGLKEVTPTEAEIGYWLGRPFWGQGYASEALDAVLGWAFTALALERITACTFCDNPASGTVLTKAGFGASKTVCEKFSLARKTKSKATTWALHRNDRQQING